MNQNPVFTVNGATAQMVRDSICPQGIRLPTIYARYPRMVHADAKTHRVIEGFGGSAIVADDCSLLVDDSLSRNGRSSRAVPVERMLREHPYTPHFMKNRPGMAATEEFTDAEREEIAQRWYEEAESVKEFVRWLNAKGVHKQWANRPLEWFGYIDVLLTATDWRNFFALREDAGAQPEMQDLAKAVRLAMENSTPRLLHPNEWHLPYITDLEEIEYGGLTDPSGILRKLATARVARLSYQPFDGNGSLDAEIRRHDLLVVSRPVHASPAEAIATPDEPTWFNVGSTKVFSGWRNVPQHGNYRGWRQYRKTLANEWIPG